MKKTNRLIDQVGLYLPEHVHNDGQWLSSRVVMKDDLPDRKAGPGVTVPACHGLRDILSRQIAAFITYLPYFGFFGFPAGNFNWGYLLGYNKVFCRTRRQPTLCAGSPISARRMSGSIKSKNTGHLQGKAQFLQLHNNISVYSHVRRSYLWLF